MKKVDLNYAQLGLISMSIFSRMQFVKEFIPQIKDASLIKSYQQELQDLKELDEKISKIISNL